LTQTSKFPIPSGLDELCGPYDGFADLLHAVPWRADRLGVNVFSLGWTSMAYQALLAEGTAEGRRWLTNRDWPIEMWSVLNMDPCVRELWQGRFSA
jgi:hypothetical protein